VVVVAGVQEGLWPDLRLRGSVLGAERLVDLLAGRAEQPAGPNDPTPGGGLTASVARETATLLDEERRLFYVAATRDRRRPVVTPSTVEVVERCSLRWLLERHGGRDAPSPEQNVCNLVHDAATRATPAVDRS